MRRYPVGWEPIDYRAEVPRRFVWVAVAIMLVCVLVPGVVG